MVCAQWYLKGAVQSLSVWCKPCKKDEWLFLAVHVLTVQVALAHLLFLESKESHLVLQGAVPERSSGIEMCWT